MLDSVGGTHKWAGCAVFLLQVLIRDLCCDCTYNCKYSIECAGVLRSTAAHHLCRDDSHLIFHEYRGLGFGAVRGTCSERVLALQESIVRVVVPALKVFYSAGYYFVQWPVFAILCICLWFLFLSRLAVLVGFLNKLGSCEFFRLSVNCRRQGWGDRSYIYVCNCFEPAAFFLLGGSRIVQYVNVSVRSHVWLLLVVVFCFLFGRQVETMRMYHHVMQPAT